MEDDLVIMLIRLLIKSTLLVCSIASFQYLRSVLEARWRKDHLRAGGHLSNSEECIQNVMIGTLPLKLQHWSTVGR